MHCIWTRQNVWDNGRRCQTTKSFNYRHSTLHSTHTLHIYIHIISLMVWLIVVSCWNMMLYSSYVCHNPYSSYACHPKSFVCQNIKKNAHRSQSFRLSPDDAVSPITKDIFSQDMFISKCRNDISNMWHICSHSKIIRCG